MEYQVARLQEIVTKIQYHCKLNFKNAVDINILLDTQDLEISDINLIIGAGVKIAGFHDQESLTKVEHLLLPCKKHFLGDLNAGNVTTVVSKFDVVESITDLEQVRLISDLNARTGKVSTLQIRMNILSGIKKFGFTPQELSDRCYEIIKTSGVRLEGMNTYVPPLDNLKLRHTALRKAGTMFKMMTSRYRYCNVMSMNYLTHFEDLIAEGVNEIRIGVKDLA